jgi:hypothetical protein
MYCLGIKHEDSHMSLKKKTSSIWIIKILNTYNIVYVNHKMESMQFLYEPMKIKFLMKFV